MALTYCGQFDKPNTVGEAGHEFGCDLQRQLRLAATARSGQRDQAPWGPEHQFADDDAVLFASDEVGPRRRQIVAPLGHVRDSLPVPTSVVIFARFAVLSNITVTDGDKRVRVTGQSVHF
jgi:hypothetical protein